VQTAIAGHAIDAAVEHRPFAEGTRQIQAFYIMDLPSMDATAVPRSFLGFGSRFVADVAM
jgi:hypothetical protein